MRRALCLVLLLVPAARPAAAQAASEMSAGYSAIRDPRDRVTLPRGWIAGAALALTPVISVVADISGEYTSIPLFTGDAELSLHAWMGGVRASGRISGLTEFVQLLAGGVRASGTAFGASTISRLFAVQPGVGVDVPLASAWAARAQIDVRLLRSEADAANGSSQYRFGAAIVYHRRPR